METDYFMAAKTPLDKEHLYEIHVYALDNLLDLENGFYLNDLFHEMRGHVLDECTLLGVYDKIV